MDGYHDKRSGFGFMLNAAGVKGDIPLYNDTNEDDSWDTVWEGAARVDSLGWVAGLESARHAELSAYDLEVGLCTATPTLSLEVYASPSATSGQYSDRRELDDPRARSYAARYGEERLENQQNPGTFRVGRDYRALFGTRPTNTLLVTGSLRAR
ncbi:MAG: hypothetical protein ACYC3Q_11995 [Gemmatimonadaceae bacterium]